MASSTTVYMRPITVERRAQIDDFASRLSLMKHEACKLGLYQTMHEIDAATKKVGWEIAEILTGARQGES